MRAGFAVVLEALASHAHADDGQALFTAPAPTLPVPGDD